MSNWKRAFGWIGHILVSAEDNSSRPGFNVVAVPAEAFNRLVEDFNNGRLDHRIRVKRLGIIDSDVYFLATGVLFSEGFEFYGTVLELDSVSSSEQSILKLRYIDAMREIYGINLPPCRVMIGCSSEH